MELTKSEKKFLDDVRNGNLKEVKKAINNIWPKIFSARVRLNIRDANGDSPLMIAIKNKCSDVAIYMIQQDIERGGSKTPYQKYLLEAVRAGDLEIIKYLLEQKKVSLECKDTNDRTPLLLAYQLGMEEIGHYLIQQGADKKAKDSLGNTLFLSAARGGNVNLIKEELNNGANINEQNENGQTALLLATIARHKSAVEFLLENNADPNLADNNHYTPLFEAVYYHSDDDISRALIRKGINIEATDKSGQTALQYGIKFRKWDRVQFLLTQGAQVNHKDNHNDWIIHTAIISDSELKVLKTLVKRGIDIYQTNAEGQDAIALAKSFFREKAVAYLEEVKRQLPEEPEQIKQYIENANEDTLVNLPQMFPALLQKIILIGELKRVFERLPYPKQKPLFKKTEAQMPPQMREEITKCIMNTRQQSYKK